MHIAAHVASQVATHVVPRPAAVQANAGVVRPQMAPQYMPQPQSVLQVSQAWLDYALSQQIVLTGSDRKVSSSALVVMTCWINFRINETCRNASAAILAYAAARQASHMLDSRDEQQHTLANLHITEPYMPILIGSHLRPVSGHFCLRCTACFGTK